MSIMAWASSTWSSTFSATWPDTTTSIPFSWPWSMTYLASAYRSSLLRKNISLD